MTVAAGTGGLDTAGSSLGSLNGCIWMGVCCSDVSGRLLLWVPSLSWNVRPFSNRSVRESGEVLERTGGFSASPLSLTEQSSVSSLDETVDWNSAFIAVEDEYSSGDKERCEC